MKKYGEGFIGSKFKITLLLITMRKSFPQRIAEKMHRAENEPNVFSGMIQQNLKDDSTKKLKYSWNEFDKKRK